MGQIKNYSCSGSAIAATLLLAAPQFAAAQTAGASDQTESAAGLEEVVVTAQKRKEDAQSTPIAMSVYTAAALAAAGVDNMQTLSAVAPDVNFAVIQGESVITIRGISSRDTTEIGDPDIPINTDGLYLNRPYSLDATMYDVDRVEVLRGPQGTLYGRNSIGGAINIVDAKPQKDFEANTSLEYGNYSDIKITGMINLPLSDTLQTRVAFLSSSHDGYRHNAPQPDGDDEDAKSVRLEVAFQPFETFQGLLTAQYTRLRGMGDVSQNIPYIYEANGQLNHALPAGINAFTFPLYTQNFLDLSESTQRWDFRYDVGGIELADIGGYDETQWHHEDDQSNQGSYYGFQQNEYPKTLSNEFRITSTASDPLAWQLGAFYFLENSHLLSGNYNPQSDGSYLRQFSFIYKTQAKSIAGFGQASYNFTDALKLTAGVRYTHDEKSRSGEIDIPLSAAPPVTYLSIPQLGSTSSSKTTEHVGLDYKVTDSNLLYAKYDTGYKAGGFTDLNQYGPETITAYEVGSKNRFLDNSLQVNLAAFYDDYKNQQVSEIVGDGPNSGGTIILNAGASRIYGAEAEVIDQVPVLGKVNVAIDYLHARFTDFLVLNAAGTANVQLAGNSPPQAPTWSIGLGLEHKWALPAGTLTGRIQSKIQTAQYFSYYDYADTRQGAYTMSDAYLEFAPGQGKWQITAFVRNLENSVVFTNAQENTFANAYSYAFYAPRTYGLRLQTKW